eukprot:TRINITY_DN7087_c0_g1_i4.p1 TRINITY_DN7087_c0_g1~~TRINITY_DN7087_c0_g1_i4.p1  ORF type:complete len:126 (-),score=16.03 TRINITY_DN7087_c0_g1_i4:192-569(-)
MQCFQKRKIDEIREARPVDALVNHGKIYGRNQKLCILGFLEMGHTVSLHYHNWNRESRRKGRIRKMNRSNSPGPSPEWVKNKPSGLLQLLAHVCCPAQQHIPKNDTKQESPIPTPSHSPLSFLSL